MVSLSQLLLNPSELQAKTISLSLRSLQPDDLVGGSTQLSGRLSQPGLSILEPPAENTTRIFMFNGNLLQLIETPSPICDPTTSLPSQIFKLMTQFSIVSLKRLVFLIHLQMVVKIGSEIAVRPAQLSVFILWVSVGLPEVFNLVPEVLKPGTSLAVRSAAVLNIILETLNLFVQLPVRVAKAFVVKMKVLIVIPKACIVIVKACTVVLKTFIVIEKARILPMKVVVLVIKCSIICSGYAMHLLQLPENFAKPASAVADLAAGVFWVI